MKQIPWNNLLKLTNIFLLISCASLFVFSGLHSRINYDAGVYLPTAKALSSGIWPYKDFLFRYPPLAVFYFAGWMKLFPGISYSGLVFTQLILVLFSAFVLWKILGSFLGSMQLRMLYTFLFVILNFYFRCFDINLEIFLCLFTLLTIWLFLKNTEKEKPVLMILAGVSTVFCFLSKQFALIIFIPVLTWLFVSIQRKEINSRSAIYYFGTVMLAFLLFLLNLFLFQGIQPIALYRFILGNEFVQNYSENNYPAMLDFILHHVLFFFPGIIFLLFGSGKKLKSETLLIMLLLLFSIFILSIRPKLNYFIIPLPFLIVMMSGITQSVKEKKYASWIGNAFCILLGWTILSISYFSYKINRRMIFTESEKKDAQYFRAELISEKIPKDKTTLNLSDPCFTYLCEFRPPHFKEYGFTMLKRKNWKNSLIPVFDERIPGSLKAADFVVSDSLSFSDYPGIEKLLPEDHFILSDTILKNIFIWKKENGN